MNNTLHLKIISPFELIFEGEISSLSSSNSSGKFDLLPEHANFITLIDKQPIEINLPQTKEKKVFNFPLSVLYCRNNQVSIYTNIDALPKLG